MRTSLGFTDVNSTHLLPVRRSTSANLYLPSYVYPSLSLSLSLSPSLLCLFPPPSLITLPVPLPPVYPSHSLVVIGSAVVLSENFHRRIHPPTGNTYQDRSRSVDNLLRHLLTDPKLPDLLTCWAGFANTRQIMHELQIIHIIHITPISKLSTPKRSAVDDEVGI